MEINSNSRARWECAAADLRTYRETQRHAWGDMDNATLGRYLAGEASVEERHQVEKSLAECPELRKVVGLVDSVLKTSTFPEEANAVAQEPKSLANGPLVLEPQSMHGRFLSIKKHHIRSLINFVRKKAGLMAAACLLFALGSVLGILFWSNRATQSETEDQVVVQLSGYNEGKVVPFVDDIVEARVEASLKQLKKEFDKQLLEAIGREQKALKKEVTFEIDKRVAQSLARLGERFYAKGEYGNAEPLLREALTTLTKLGTLYRNVRDYQNGLLVFEQARDLTRKLRTEDHPDYANCLNNLAALYQDMGAYQKALPLYEQARDLTKKLLTENHRDYADCLNNLAALYQHMGEYNKSQAYLVRALAIRKKAFGDSHPAVADTLYKIGRVAAHQRKKAEADRYFERALRIWSQTSGGNSSQTVDRLRLQRALALSCVGKYTEAAAEAKKLAERTAISGGDLYELAVVNALASLAVTQDRHLSASRRAELSEDYLTRATNLLVKASENGFFKSSKNVARVKNDDDLKPLRLRKEFKELMRKVDTTERP
jgi:tetratricopeptide (TPR) repeat protein